MRWLAFLAAVLAVTFAAVDTTATASTQPVTQCAASANPCAGYQDNTPSKVVSIWCDYDSAGIPIFCISNAGGAKMFGDNFTVYGPGSVTTPAVQLRPDGTVLVGGQVFTPHDVRFVHCLEQPQQTAASCRKVTP